MAQTKQRGSPRQPSQRPSTMRMKTYTYTSAHPPGRSVAKVKLQELLTDRFD
jgi:hypothetical protein